MNIFFFGDSICSGQGVSIHRIWIHRLSQDIEKLGHQFKTNITVFNSFENGGTTRQALERMPHDIQSYGVDLLVVQYGMNDCNYWITDHGVPRVSPKAFEANLQEIIDRAKIFGACKVYLNTNHPTVRTKKFPYSKISYEDSKIRYNNIVRKVAKNDREVMLNDVEKYFQNYITKNKQKISKFLLRDGIHLNLLGHNLYYQFIHPRILSTLEKMLSRS